MKSDIWQGFRRIRLIDIDEIFNPRLERLHDLLLLYIYKEEDLGRIDLTKRLRF